MESPGRPENQDSFRRFGNDAKSRNQAKNPVLAPISTPPRTPRVESLGPTLDKLGGDKERSGRTIVVSKPAGPSPAESQRGARPGAMRVTRPITPKVNSLQSTLELLASDKERSDQLLDLERSRLQALADVEVPTSQSFAPRAPAEAPPEGFCLERAAAEARDVLIQGVADGGLSSVLGELQAMNGRVRFMQTPSVGTWLAIVPSNSETSSAASPPKQVMNDPCLRKTVDNPWAALYGQFPACQVQSRKATKPDDPCLRKSADNPWAGLYQQFPDYKARRRG